MNNSTTFIFVIGAPRSGTTWLHKMIAEHPDVFSLNGSNTFLQNYIFPFLEKYKNENKVFTEKGFTRGIPSKLNQDEWDQLIADYIKRFYEIIPDSTKFYVEKATDLTSEIHNIKKFIPNSKFIHIIRDGRNETLSEIKLRKQYGAPFGIQDIYKGAYHWKKQVEEARINSAGFRGDYFEIYYEELFENTSDMLDKVFQFVGMRSDKDMANKISDKYNYKTNVVSMPTSGVANKQGKLINPYEKEMSKVEQALFEYIAGDLLDSLRYPNKNILNNKFFLFFIKYFWMPYYFIKKFFGKKVSSVKRHLSRKYI